MSGTQPLDGKVNVDSCIGMTPSGTNSYGSTIQANTTATSSGRVPAQCTATDPIAKLSQESCFLLSSRPSRRQVRMPRSGEVDRADRSAASIGDRGIKPG